MSFGQRREVAGLPRLAVVIAGVLVSLVGAAQDPPRRVPVLIDTDIGSTADDPFALALLAASDRVELLGVSTCGESAEDRAWIACRFLSSAGKATVPVAWGRDPQPKGPIDWQIQYRRHPAVVWGRSSQPVGAPAEDFLYAEVSKRKGEVTLLATGPLTNIARLLERHPGAKPWIRRVVLMGGALRVGYSGAAPPEPEWNVRSDVAAARTVLGSGLDVVVVPLDATAGLKLGVERLGRIFGAHNVVTHELQALLELSGEKDPVVYDLAAAAILAGDLFFRSEPLRLEVDDSGMTRSVVGQPNASVVYSLDREGLRSWFEKALIASGEPRLPRPPSNLCQPVARRGLPLRVHVVEDYETEIERRWWLAGRRETQAGDAGAGSVCRSTIIQDFDDRMGDAEARYSAVVFNPVPGPPMGKNTRLTFRYKLRGSDALRVQIYSLSNGYHRCLALSGLPDGRWEEATVDMTLARRPDSSGGALAEDERIDDIQFYADPRADFWIDWLVLYDEAPPGEARPFPTRVAFTGWFDTGAQGREWPGDFEIVKHSPPRTWKSAKSVLEPQSGRPWIRLGLRGERALGARTQLRLQYRIEGASSLTVEVVHTPSGRKLVRELAGLKTGEWAEATAEFLLAEAKAGEEVQRSADEVRFFVPDGAALLVDDVLLFESGAR